MVGQRRTSLLTRSCRLFAASRQVRAQDPGALRKALEIIIGEEAYWKRRAADGRMKEFGEGFGCVVFARLLIS